LHAKQCALAGEHDKAEQIYRKLTDNMPTPQAYRELFQLYIRHDRQGAEKVARIVNDALVSANRKDDPPAPHAKPTQLRSAVTALRENDNLARPVLKAAADLALREPVHIDALQIFAAIADRLEMLPEAEILYTESIKQPLPPATEALIYGGLLRVLWKNERYEAVIQTCRKALKETQASNTVVLRVDLARALSHLKRWDEALAEADLAVQGAAPNERFTVRLMKARLLAQADRNAQAEAECQILLKESSAPGEAIEVHYLMSGIFSVMGKLAQAEVALQECLKIDADNATINNDLGYLWADQNKRLPEAEAMIRKAILIDRKERQSGPAFGPKREFHDNAMYIDSLGWVLFKQGKLDQALTELLKANAMPEGDDAVIWDHLGEVYAAQGRKAEAIASWRKALDFYAGAKQRKIEDRIRVIRAKMKQLQSGLTPN
jgi:tetratricopeptide (TPR) repeat protein